MDLLYATADAPFPLVFSGGAWRSAHELLCALDRQGLSCAAVGGHPDGPPGGPPLRLECGYPVTLYADLLAELDALLARHAPRVVGTHLHGAIEVVRRARRFGAQPAWFIRNAECEDHPASHLEEARALGARFMASSPFLARHMRNAHGVETTLLWSAVDVDQYRVPLARDGFITMVNPVEEKGLVTLMGLVLRAPGHRFLIVEGWKQNPMGWQDVERVLGHLPNVRLMRAVRDMREVYRQTRVLLVPSVWKEGFGRVVAEAHASGIPVIARRVGCFADLAAGAILVDRLAGADAWAEAVDRVCGDAILYERLSREALERSATAEYRAESVAARFVSDLAGCGVSLGVGASQPARA
jgi:glycosyltransferase involved in cell wall biosynthesis